MVEHLPLFSAAIIMFTQPSVTTGTNVCMCVRGSARWQHLKPTAYKSNQSWFTLAVGLVGADLNPGFILLRVICF